MTAARDLSTADGHLSRAAHHRMVGDALYEAGPDEWSAVCYFYAAYHQVHAALRLDPVFDDLTRLKSFHHSLTPDDRNPRWHQGRHGSGPGMNEVVNFIYPTIKVQYRLLHMASTQVRYQDCLAIRIEDCRQHMEEIMAAYDAGSIVATTPQ